MLSAYIYNKIYSDKNKLPKFLVVLLTKRNMDLSLISIFIKNY